MSKSKFCFLLFVFLGGYVLFGQKPHPKDDDYNPNDIPTTPRANDVIVPIMDIETPPSWNTLACPENPDTDANNLYAGAFADKDANKLRTIPYSDNNSSGNSFLNNHTFWFAFGCCGEAFCADDLDGTFIYTDPTWNVGSLALPDVNTDDAMSIWVDFLTQCENCMGFGEGGTGVWHKWERQFDMGEIELIGFDSYPNGLHGAVLELEGTPSCDIFSVYGCQSGELD